MNSLPFVDRQPTASEVERVRLLLSTYQDGTGMLQVKNSTATTPGWRDFERSVALALSGSASESKEVFDVILSRPDSPKSPRYGLSCKMRRELDRIDRDGRVTIEVSNSSGEFWKHLQKYGLNQTNYKQSAQAVGEAIIELVDSWHAARSLESGGTIDTSQSYYLVLSWSRVGIYQLHQFPLGFVRASDLQWDFPVVKGKEGLARRLTGSDETGALVEWYGESGGQLKFYPFAKDALWQSHRFTLEPLPEAQHGIINKAHAYFAEKWEIASQGLVESPSDLLPSLKTLADEWTWDER